MSLEEEVRAMARTKARTLMIARNRGEGVAALDARLVTGRLAGRGAGPGSEEEDHVQQGGGSDSQCKVISS